MWKPSETVVAVAKALHAKNRFYGPDDPRPFSVEWDVLTDRQREIMCEYAVEAIKALREPTEAMHAAGNNEMDDMEAGNEHAFAEHIWRAMIDAALEPKDG